MGRKTSECKWIVLALVLVVFVGTASSCSKKDDSTNSNTEEPNTNETANVASPTPTAPSTPAAPAFQGTWTNKDPAARGITKLVITQNGSEVKVHAWGKCHPTDCDWGEQSGGIIDNAAVLTWDQKFVIRKMKLTLEGNNELRAVTQSVYSDNRPRRTSEEVFVKQS